MSQIKHFIEGNTIYLREVRESDVNDNYYAWLNNSEVNQYLETRYYPRSKANIADYVKHMDGLSNEIFFAMCDKKTNKHIGNIKIGPINWIHRYGDISLLIGDQDFWGKGIATEAIRLVTEFGFFTLNLHKIKAGCYEQNVGSAKAFEKVGFIKEGLLKKQWMVKGKYYDEILLGLCIEDYKP
ncbi:MAG: GNAT family N-acetyltransferase [Bacteroidia bacterium]|nr:GNAT family N-acetyltransferase [Bacteroidia bacterium]